MTELQSDKDSFAFPSPPGDHFSNGGTLVTNYDENRHPVYVEALKRHGDRDLYLGPGTNGYAHGLHCKKHKDLSAFWRTHRVVDEAMKTGSALPECGTINDSTPSAPSSRGCPNIGQFGFCESSGCAANLGGPCAWMQQNAIITYDNRTTEDSNGR